MKVTKISIKDFHQFKDLEIDLTYPKGHAKEGQPLDKVCFIGQSGTGKTSILELIPMFVVNYNTDFIDNSGETSISDVITIDVSAGLENEFTHSVYFQNYGEEATMIFDSPKCKGEEVDSVEYNSIFEEWLGNTATKMIYFPANLEYDISIPSLTNYSNNVIVDFSVEMVTSVWKLILEKIQKYQEQELQIRQEISKTVEVASNNLETIKNALKKLEDWKKAEFNPIQDIADNCLNRLLSSFKLRVKTELDIKSKDDLGFIKIEDYAGNEIPHALWSTGTKQVVLGALPLYLLKPKHTIILFDEPERSLYPDLQRMIVDYYSSLTDNCQFFYATHSPIIASSFEPWEIVELKFNGEGKIYRELYYEGDNHVDNYKYNPRYMRWDDILQRIFDMENDGSDERKKKLYELAASNIKYNKLRKQGKAETDEGLGVLEQIQALSKQLSYWKD